MNIRTPLAIASTALLTLALGACAHTEGGSAAADTEVSSDRGMASGSGSMSSSAGGGGAGASAKVPVATSAAEALALVALVDQHEVKLAQQAKSKNVTGSVLEYANLMETHHTQHLSQTRALQSQAGGAPSSGPGVQMLTTLDQQTQARLGGLQGEAYARAYIAHMVESHRMGVAMVDAAMPKVEDAALRSFMTATRQSMQMHLERAKAIQSALGG